MPNLNIRLQFASLIPDFIYQFLSNDFIDSDNLTCLELEDVREAIASDRSAELEPVRKFLAVEEGAEIKREELRIKNEEEKYEKLEEMADRLDAELEEVDDEYYHRYTPGELKFVFEKIHENVDKIYGLFKADTGTNMCLAIGFKTKGGLESNMVIEFLHMDEKPEYMEDVFFLPMDNYLMSDDIISRVYFYYEKEKEQEYKKVFDDVVKLLQLKPE